jgi:hypothetical protein
MLPSAMRRPSLVLVLLALGAVAGLAACPGPVEVRDHRKPPAAGGDPAGGGGVTVPADSAQNRADGAACDDGAQCASGVCEGEGCDHQGTCMPKERACTRDFVAYCGCDGQVFRGSGTCPGQRFAHRGSCP